MIYDILYTNYSKWKSVIFWKNNIMKSHEIWTGDKIKYNNLKHLHGNFNLFKYGHHGLEASTMICFIAAYNLLSKSFNIDRLFLDNIIRTGIDLYQTFLHTDEGKRSSVYKKGLITEAKTISKFFEDLYEVNIYDTSLVEFADGERPNLYNYNEWLEQNISFYTDKAINNISDYACLISVNHESIVFFWDSESETYYLYDPQGRGLAFFNIPSNQRQNFFVTSLNEEIEYSDMTSYILKSKSYNDIIEFIEKNIPFQRNFRSWYITL